MAWILVLNPPLLRPIAWSSPFFLSAGAVLMRAYNGAVDHRVFVVGIGCQHFEYLLPCAALRPARKPRMNLNRVSKTFRQVAPRYACAITVKHRLDEQPVILGGDANMARTAGQKILDPVPLIIPKGVAAHLSAPNQLTSRESRRYALGNPLIEDRLYITP